MSAFFSKYKFILIAIAVIFLIFIVYGFVKPAPSGSDGISTTVVANDSGELSNNNGLAGELSDSFVVQLLAIQNINFNTEFFNDPVYRGLIDQYRSPGVRPVGRPNPFFPIGQDNGFVGSVTTPALNGTATSSPATAVTATTTSTSTTSGRTTTPSRTTTTSRTTPAR